MILTKKRLKQKLGLGGLFAEEGEEGGGLVGLEGYVGLGFSGQQVEGTCRCAIDDEAGSVAPLAVLLVWLDAGDFGDGKVCGRDEGDLFSEVAIFERCEGAEPDKHHEERCAEVEGLEGMRGLEEEGMDAHVQVKHCIEKQDPVILWADEHGSRVARNGVGVKIGGDRAALDGGVRSRDLLLPCPKSGRWGTRRVAGGAES